MRSNRGWSDVVMRNISSRGMLLEASDAPDTGSYIEVRKGDHVLVCRVMWSEGAQFGVFAQDKLDLNAIASAGTAAPARHAEDGSVVERRSQDRVAALASQADRNRLLANAFQSAVIAAGSIMAAAFMADAAKAALERPLTVITHRL